MKRWCCFVKSVDYLDFGGDFGFGVGDFDG